MKDWNKTGKIKAIILVIIFGLNIIAPMKPQHNFSYILLIAPFLFGVIGVPVITKINASIFGHDVKKPTWNDNPCKSKNPLSFSNFSAFFFLAVGLGMAIGTATKFLQVSFLGLITVSFSIGTLIGNQLLLKINKK